MEWIASDGNPIKFDNKKAKFFLTWGTEPSSVANPYNNATSPIKVSKGYIDLVGLQIPKAQGICADLGGCGFILRKGDEILNREGFIPNKAFHVKTTVKRSNEELLALKKAKKEFGLAIKNKYNSDVQHSLTNDQIWSKYAQKAILWS